MLRSMYSGLSGLKNHEYALDVIGDNISNVNTAGFKRSTINFTDLLGQTLQGASKASNTGLGGTNPIQIGLGVGTTSITVNHEQGNLQTTGVMNDLAIQGNGFFILSDGSDTLYSRAGNFLFDSNGMLVTTNGWKVMGWTADANGTINKATTISAIRIPVGETIEANATSTIEYAYNLDSRADMTGSAKLVSGNSANIDRAYGQFAITDNAYLVDSFIGSHVINVYSEKHLGENTSLSTTKTLSQLGVSDVSTFRVVVDGNRTYPITLKNELNTTVDELISAINTQVEGVTAYLDINKIVLTRNQAGSSYSVEVYDASQSTDGVAANIFGNGDGKWANHAKTVGLRSGLSLTDSLNSLGAAWDNSNRLNITIGTNTFIFDPSSLNGAPGGDTVADLIDSFNDWSYITFGARITPSLFTSIAGIDSTLASQIQTELESNGFVDSITGKLTATYDPTNPSFDIGLSPIFSEYEQEILAILRENEGGDVFMGLNKAGQLYVASNNSDGENYIRIADEQAATQADGIADLFFSSTSINDWTVDETTYEKHSQAAYINHEYQDSMYGNIYSFDLDFNDSDTAIEGIAGVTILSTEDGFKTGSLMLNTTPAASHLVTTKIYDSQGNAHNVTLTFTRAGSNIWNWTASGVGVQAGEGSLTFDSNGKLLISQVDQPISLDYATTQGASEVTIQPNFNDATQFASASTMVHYDQDGYPYGTLSTFSIDTNGEIVGIYTNGLNTALGQIAMANFNNPSGLTKTGLSMFRQSNNSGEAQVGMANTGGRGSISAGSIEMSNVDIAQEFTNMIIYQRGFQANSKTISTADELLQTVINIKR